MAMRVYCEHSALTKTIRQMERRGLIEVMHFPYDPNSHTHKIRSVAKPSNALIQDLNIQISALPCSLADYSGSDYLEKIISIVGRANRRDGLHIDSAFKEGCLAFVTSDSDILNHKAELQRLLGIRFFRPDENRDLEQFVTDYWQHDAPPTSL